MSSFYKLLFKQHTNGTIGTWAIDVSDNQDGTATLTSIAAKVLGGAEVKTPRIISSGKNIGRANETTALQQAISEANAKVAKKIKGGYVETEEEAQVKATNGLGFIKPMLAKPIDEVKNWSYPVFQQRKFDGHRLLATVDQNETVVLYSRDGNLVNLPHIHTLLQSAYDAGVWAGGTLDGEIYKHGESLQRISSMVKKRKEGSDTLVYNLYDIHEPDVCYTERLSIIRQINEFIDSEYVDAAETVIIQNEDEMEQFHKQALIEGFEGSIIRLTGIGYEDGKRSKSLIKKKNFDDNEYKIVGFKLGTPKITNNQTFQLPVFKCETPSGITFDCNAPGNVKERHALYEQGLESFVGKQLTVKHFGFTDNGTPFIPTPLRLRIDL